MRFGDDSDGEECAGAVGSGADAAAEALTRDRDVSDWAAGGGGGDGPAQGHRSITSVQEHHASTIDGDDEPCGGNVGVVGGGGAEEKDPVTDVKICVARA